MLVTLLTDFGTADYFVGAMKGALLSVCPGAQVVDITHEIAAHDIEAGAFTLLAAYETFPAGTIHVAVVDPGVGSTRRPLLVAARSHLFVGPDNGLFSYIVERERNFTAYHLTNEKYFRPHVSTTFHGRDIFAPVAGALACGFAPAELGEPVTDFVRLERPAPRRTDEDSLEASVIHIDRFGNCITNITRADLTAGELERGVRLLVGRREIRRVLRFFAEGESIPHEPFAIWGSAGLLEISVFRNSAARLLGITRGHKIRVTSDKQDP